MPYRRLLIFSLLVLLSLTTARVMGQSTIGVWSRAQRLGGGWFPSMAVDATGMVHIGWHGAGYTPTSKPGEDHFWYTTGTIDSDVLNEPVDVLFTGFGGFTIRSAMDTTSTGLVYVMYRDITSHKLAVAPASHADAATAWQVVREFKNNSYYPSMIIDRHDVIHAVSSEQGANLLAGVIDVTGLSVSEMLARYPCAMCADLIYRRSKDGGRTWDPSINLSRTTQGSERQDILEGASGRLYVSWSEGFDGYTNSGSYQDGRIIYSDDGGSTWSDPIILSGDGKKPVTQIALTETQDGGMLVVWYYDDVGDRHVYFQQSADSGATWTEPQPVPTILTGSHARSQLDRYHLLTDLAGTVHLFAVGYDEANPAVENPKLFHFEYRQERWLGPDVLYGGPYKPEWPTAAVGPRNELHVAWFIRIGNGKSPGDPGETFVYYARRSATMPDNPVEVAFAPTLTPSPQPTEVPVFEATSTLMPTFAPIDTSVSIHRNQDLNAVEVLLGAVFAVGVLCVGVLFIFGFRPRL